MSMYGPPGGPYPGQPQDPWETQGRRTAGDDDSHAYLPENYASEQEWGPQSGGGYSQPPYRSGYDYPRSYTSGYDNGSYDHAGYDAGYADPSYADPRYGDQNYGDQSFGPGREPIVEAPEPPSHPGRGPLIAVVVIVSLLVVGGVGSYLLYQGRQNNVASGPRSGSPVSTTPRATQPASPNVSAAPSAGTGSPVAPDGDAFAAKVGDCLINRGDEGHPAMKKVACGPNTYQVLKRIDGTADKARCNGTPNLTDWYFYDHPDNSRDFVLCLHKR